MSSKPDNSGIGCLFWLGVLMAIVGSALLYGPTALLWGGVAMVAFVVLVAFVS